MTVTVEEIDSAGGSVRYSVPCTDLNDRAALGETFDHLDVARAKFAELVAKESLHYYAHIAVVPAEPIEKPENLDEFDEESVWWMCCPPFWKAAIQVPELKDRAQGHFADLLKIMAEAPVHSDQFFEDEETHFCEPVLYYLAAADIDFVPTFAQFLRQWDMDHSVNVQHLVPLLVEEHGICTQTEDLIEAYLLDNPAYVEAAPVLLDALHEHYGEEIAQVPLFRALVFHAMSRGLSAAVRDLDVYAKKHRKGLDEKRPNLNPAALLRKENLYDIFKSPAAHQVVQEFYGDTEINWGETA